MSTEFTYEILVEPNINIIYKFRDYFKTFNCSVYMSKNNDNRRVNAKSLIGILSLDLRIKDTIILYFIDDVNVQMVKDCLNLIN